MAANMSSEITNHTGTGTTSGTRKRKAATRKTAGVSPAVPKAAVQKASSSASAAEIVFTNPPTPGQEPIPPYIWIDYPQQKERLNAEKYVIRLGVGGAEVVELSIDRGPWQACRLTSGYWWFDWAAISRGRHTLTARMRTAGGQWYRTPERSCEY